MTALTFVPDGLWTDAWLGEIVVADIEDDEGEGFRARSYLPYRGSRLFPTLDEAKRWVVAVQDDDALLWEGPK